MTSEYTGALQPTFNRPGLSKSRLHRYVALKIAVAANAGRTQERNALERLNKALDHEAGRPRPVPRMLDTSSSGGQNGIHDILVLEPMGRSLEKHIWYLQNLEYEAPLDNRRVGFMREISRQLVNAVHFLHSHGVVHRGLPLLYLT